MRKKSGEVFPLQFAKTSSCLESHILSHDGCESGNAPSLIIKVLGKVPMSTQNIRNQSEDTIHPPCGET